MNYLKIKDTILRELKVFWGNEPDSMDEAIPVIKTNNLSYNGRISFDNITLRDIEKDKIGDNYLKKGDLLIEKSGGTKTHSVGYVNYFDGLDNCYVANNFILALRPNQELINSRYLFFQMRYFYEKGIFEDCYNKTTGIQNLKKDIYLSKTISVPSIDKQFEIANVLQGFEDLITLKKEELKKVDESVKSRFNEMFGDITNESNNTVKLGLICKTMGGGTPTTKKPEYYEGNIPWITTVSLGPNYVDGSNAKGYITQEAIDNSSTKLIPTNSVMVGTRVGVGKCSVNTIPICTNQDINSITGLDSNKYIPLFIKFVVDSYQSFFDSIKKGATILGITSDDLKNINVPTAPLNRQKEFVYFVEQIEKSKLIIQKQIDLLQELLDKKMNEYFG